MGPTKMELRASELKSFLIVRWAWGLLLAGGKTTRGRLKPSDKEKVSHPPSKRKIKVKSPGPRAALG